MLVLRWMGAGLLWILAGVFGLLGGLLCLTIILMPLGIPLLMLAKRRLRRRTGIRRLKWWG